LFNSGIAGIIGTFAGDDTVLVVSKKSNGGVELAKELLSFSKVSRNSKGKRKARR
jgi:transcriptional regulator of arginine metabolism